MWVKEACPPLVWRTPAARPCPAPPASSKPTSEGTEEERQLKRLCASFLTPALISRAWFPPRKPTPPAGREPGPPHSQAADREPVQSRGKLRPKRFEGTPQSLAADSWQIPFLQNCSKLSLGPVDISQQRGSGGQGCVCGGWGRSRGNWFNLKNSRPS